MRLAPLFGVVLAVMGVSVVSTKGPAPVRPRGGVVNTVRADPDHQGLAFRIGEGQEGGEAPAKITRPQASPLGEADTARVLGRLPQLETDADDVKEFALRERSLPPPRTGRTVAEAFPPAPARQTPSAIDAGPLRVLRHSPDGDVPLAPHLSLTFSQPMVAVTAYADLARETVPARLTPQPKGAWRYVGTKTLLYEPEGRFPMATRYEVEVPAGTRSATGGTLSAAERFVFTTPAPSLVARYPENTPARRDALLFAVFDQRVDPGALLGSLRITAGGHNFAPRLATEAEIASDEVVKSLVARSEKGRFVAFRTQTPLPPATPVTVSVEAGAPSAEGPIKTAAAQAWGFQTYGPMKITDHRCGWNSECPPFSPWQIVFSNPIDAKGLDRSGIRVTPALAGMKIVVYGSTLQIQGASKGRTTYTVAIPAGVPDTFGQASESSETLRFNVTAAHRSFQMPGGDFVVLDPNGPPRISAYTVNYERLRVRAYAVTPDDFARYRAFAGDAARNVRGATQPPGRLARETTLAVRPAPDELVETSIDLRDALGGRSGHLVVAVEPLPARSDNEGGPESARAWVQSTQIGLDAFVDNTDVVAWATSLKDGSPIAGASIEMLPGGARATTDATGVARVALRDASAHGVIARVGGDVAFVPENTSWWSEGGGWRRQTFSSLLRYFVFDDRHLYRPGEEVKVKGWVRSFGADKGGDIGLVSGLGALSFTLKDSQGNEIAKGERPIGALGGFDLSLKLPPTMNLGPAQLEVAALAGSPTVHSFDVQEFRRPEFEVKVAASEGPHVVGGSATATVAASYFAGGALPDAAVSWDVNATPGFFHPPNWEDFSFGVSVPWWDFRPIRERPGRSEHFEARTDGAGKHVLRIDFDGVTPPQPTTVTATASVMDVNRQAWTDSTTLVVHPASVYVGLRSERYFVNQGERLNVDAVVIDLDGTAIVGSAVDVRAERIDWEQDGDEWKEKVASTETCPFQSGKEATRCGFLPTEGGSYRVTATVRDDKGRANETRVQVWVAGGTPPRSRNLEQEKVLLIPSRKTFAPGDTAEILVVPPFSPAEGVLTLRRSGIVRSERFSLKGSSHTLRVPIDDAMTPNVHVQVDLVGATARTKVDGSPDATQPKRPAFASGALNVEIPPRQRTLTVKATPAAKKIEPGGQTSVDIDVRDAAGRGVAGGEVAVVVVDEAVLALGGYQTPDPLNAFYAQRDPGTADHRSRAWLVLARPEDFPLKEYEGDEARLRSLGYAADAVMERAALPASAPAPQMAARMMAKAGGAGAPTPPPIRVRKDLGALAYFAPAVVTDANGHARVDVKVPDNLTRYRIVAVAVAGAKQFGTGESTLTARLPLMVRPSAPRFLNFGDRFELPVVVQNQTDASMNVDVVVRASNADLTSGAGRRVSVPANDRVEVLFPMSAVKPGTARIQVGAAADRWADAAEVSLPVWTPATTEAFATYGHIDDGAIRQPVKAPTDAVTQFGGLEVTTSSTALQALTDAVLYLVSYKFECAEQISSRVLAVAALRDVLTAFEAKDLPPPAAIAAAVQRDVERLRALQNDDGGFAFWRRGDRSWPYLGIHVAHALERAKAKGFDVPDDVLRRSKEYLRNIEAHIPSDYPEEVRRTLIAYALSVRARLGDPDAARARKLANDAGLDKLSFEAIGWLLGVLSPDKDSAAEVDGIRRHLANRATETASTAHFAVAYGDGAHLILHSDRRADAILLEALIADQPKNDLIPKLVEGLLAHRVAGRWENTQENVFVLLALDRFFSAYEKTPPDFVARIWLGRGYAGDHAFKGRSTDRSSVSIPMAYLAARPGTEDLVLSKEGPGRLYYRVGLSYAPKSLRLDASDHGFTVERVYEAVDDKGDVSRDKEGWHIKAGARVRVRLTMVAPERRYHVALVDPLPAGLEALNPGLAMNAPVGPAGLDQTEVVALGARGLGDARGRRGSWWWWRGPWFEHQNLRDERAEAFTSLLWEGVYTYTYVARATTPGTFVVPPAKAEEMHHPETFGRGGSDIVKIR